MTPRPYQLAAIDELRQGIRTHPGQPGLLVAPTGSGKSEIFGWMARAAVAKGKRIGAVVNRRILVRDLCKRVERLGLDYGVIMGSAPRKAWSPVHVASFDTLWRREQLPKWDLVFVDECHFSLADKYAQVLARLQADGCIIIGMTATPIRGVLEGLGAIYKWMVRCPDTPDLIDAGYLVPPRVFAPPPPDLKGVPLVAGEYNQKQLAVACNSTKITGDILKHWIANGRGRPTIGFGVDIKHCKDMAAAFCAASVRAIAIDHTYKGDFDLVWRKLANYETEVVFNVGIAGYGWDCPPCSMMIEARPTMSLGLWLQHCLDAKTEILTPDGWKTHADIAVGSRVAAFDMKTSAIKWLPATDVVRRPLTKQEVMYEIRSPHLDIRVTDNHDMIFRSLGKTAVNWRKGTAEFLSSKPSHFRLPVCGNQQSTGVQLSDYDLRFIGWFLTDRTLGKDNNQITISQAEGKKENEDIAEVLRGCGFKYGVTRVVRKGELAHCRPLLQYRISKGLPRGSQKHLTGWGRLEPFIDKRLSEWLEFLTRTQLLILLSAMNLGDGTKDNRSWTRRTMEINCGDNSVMAERIQSLCVRRGLRCNITTARNVGRKPWHTLRISLRQSATVGGGCSEEGRSRMAVSPSTHGELVWCVTNDLGAIVTRRNGKVAIVGNCGRVMRVHPGKQDAIINDHAGNSHRHGLPSWPRDWSLDGEAIRHGPGDGAMSVTTCRACYATFKSGPEKCPYCGKLLPKKAREVKIEDGELAEFQPATPKPMSPSAQLGLYAVLRKTQEMRGYKPAWCAMVFKSKTGHFPPGQWRQRTLEELEAALPKKMEVVQL